MTSVRGSRRTLSHRLKGSIFVVRDELLVIDRSRNYRIVKLLSHVE